LALQQGGGVIMERTYKEYILPVSKNKVQVYDYYLRGDRVAIEQIMTDAVVMTAEGTVSSVKTGYRYDMEDEAVIRAVKEMKTEQGTDIEVNITNIRELSEDDYEFLTSRLPKENEKKSTTKPSEGISEKPQKNGE
jgi:hypothetical protein